MLKQTAALARTLFRIEIKTRILYSKEPCYFVESPTTDNAMYTDNARDNDRESQSVDMYIKDVEQVCNWQYVTMLSFPPLTVSESHNLLTCTLRLLNSCGSGNMLSF